MQPYNGGAYVGLLLENCSYPSCSGWWIEYVQAKLVDTLIAGKTYEFSCRIALSNNYYQYAFGGFGALFSQAAVTRADAKPFEFIPQIFADTVLTDTTWMEIKENFIATGDEVYITLGFFLDTLNIDTLITDPWFDPNNFGSYYYVDRLILVDSLYSSIDESEICKITVTPNPSNGIFTITATEKIDQISIYNSLGQLVKFESPHAEISQLDLFELPLGIYYAICELRGKIVSVKLIIN